MLSVSFVSAQPAELIAAAGELTGIGSAMAVQNAAAAVATTAVVPAAADPVSALTAAQFSAHGSLYQAVSAHADAIHQMFVTTLMAGCGAYEAAEAANAIAAR